jgi:serpin B
MGVAFANGADFTGINPTAGLYISLVQHKAHVEVNEVGTVAAAATGVGISNVSLCEGDFRVNQPFIFFIRERFSGTILFMGRVVDPSRS